MMTPEPATLTIEPRGGAPLRLRFDAGALGASGGEGDDEARTPWSVEGEVDWAHAESLRLLSARFDDGRELAIASLRPRDASGHDADDVASHLLEGGEPVAVDEALVSTEYDPAGLPRRVGIELWIDPDSPPIRVAADREGAVEVGGAGPRREVARMRFRLPGAGGRGLHEVLRPD